jgi:hypothetical protein
MSNPSYAFGSPGHAALTSFARRLVGEARGEGSRRVARVSRDRYRSVRAEARRRRVVSVCRRELLRHDAAPGRGR